MARVEKQQLQNRETGEVLYALVPVERSPMGRRFFMVMQDAFEHLGKLRLPSRTYSVFAYPLSKLDFNNWIHLEQAEIAAALNLKRPDVSKSMKQLEAQGIIARGPKAGRAGTYRLDPHFGWKGSVKEHKVALSEAQQRGWRVLRNGAKE